MHGRITTLGVVLGLFISGCQESRYVTRAEFDAWKAGQVPTGAVESSVAGHDQAITRLYGSLKGIKQAVGHISENLANADTIGYKAVRIEFAADGAEARGVSEFVTGSPMSTGGDFDLMIQGDGFFKVAYPHHARGFAYTRAGNFFRNRDGDLVLDAADGLRLEPVINIPEGVTGIEVSTDGTIRGFQPGSLIPAELGRVELTRFINPRGLERQSGSLFFQTETSGYPLSGTPGESQFGTILHKFLERSNVDPDMEMASLTKLNWRYEETMHAIQMLGSRRAVR